ncbi:MAG: nucleotidyltransferase family protein [Candidatus Obscuribacterales bacterium]|nr:nucleotidyltransferase family protein [Candidatus Obscuribacterales bacterium]
MRPEYQLLLFAARGGNCAEFPAELERLLSEPIDWTALLRIAQKHRLLEMLYWTLRQRNRTIPEEFLSKIEKASSFTAKINERLLTEIVSITKIANQAQIPLIHMKGAALAASVYNESWLRHHGDLDILVPVEHFAPMLDLLKGEQYEPTVIETKEKATWETLHRAEVRALGWAVTVRHSRKLISIDLHWRLMKNSVCSIPIAETWNHRSFFDYRGNQIPVFEPSMNFLYLARHAAKHGWTHLRWIADLVALAESREFDFEALLQFATRYEYRRFVLFALELVRRCPGTRLPDSVVSAIEVDPAVRQQAEFIWQQLFIEERDLTAKECLAHLSALEDSRFRAMRIYADAFATPTLRDWEQSPLALPLFGLFHLLRPMRLLKQYGFRKKRR